MKRVPSERAPSYSDRASFTGMVHSTSEDSQKKVVQRRIASVLERLHGLVYLADEGLVAGEPAIGGFQTGAILAR